MKPKCTASETFKRKSEGRIYSHAIITHLMVCDAIDEEEGE
jgi:hypothetical protein